jgi:hypothetical protein
VSVARLLRAFLVVMAGIIAGVSLYVGLVQADVVRNPFAPVLRGDLDTARSDRPGMRVLFVGNSWTYYHDMPQMVQRLAAADIGARPVFAVSYTRPGWDLRSASHDRRLVSLIGDVRWNTVVLQEQTGRARSSVEQRSRETDPYVRDLQSRIQARGARTLLYMTWPYRDRSDLGSVLGLPVAPVGTALSEAYWRRSGLTLWLEDGHPNQAGSFLAACVFYTVLTRRNPARSTYSGGLPEADAQFLKELAAELLNDTS